MKHILILLLSVVVMQGCSVYGGLTKCDGFDEAGTRCTSLISNLDYSKQREKGIYPVPEDIEKDAKKSKQEQAETTPDGIVCADSTEKCIVKIDYSLLDIQVKNDEFARLTIDKKIGMSETDPVLRPAKTVKTTIYPYSDGSKFYQLRHIWIKTIEEAWIVGSTMVVDSKGTVMMDKGVNINMSGANLNKNKGNYYEKEQYSPGNSDNIPLEVSSKTTNEETQFDVKTNTSNLRDSANRESGANNGVDTTAPGTGGRSASGSDVSDGKLDQESAKNNLAAKFDDKCSLESEGCMINVFKSGDIVTINVVYLNVRNKPSAESRIIGVIPAGGKLRILDDKEDKWQRVKVVYYPKNKLKKEYDGWVHSGYLMAVNPGFDKWEDGL